MDRENELLAVISAAVAAMEEKSGVRLVVTSYKRVDQVSPVWNTVGRAERLRIYSDKK